MIWRRFSQCIFCFAMVLCCAHSNAQNQFGAAQGTIKDSEGHPIPGVTILLSSELWGSTKAYTDKGGRYRIESLIPGIYQLQAQLVGFQSVMRSDVRISAGNVITVDLTIEPKKVTESVTVESETPVIDSTTTAVSHTIPSEIVQGMPERQDFRALLALTPGVGNDGTAYGGSPNTSNRIWIDGVNVSNASTGGIFHTTYNYNWIEEVQVIGNGAPAEYGNYSGVIGNFVTRSGGNQFHGLIESFFHNENLVSTNTPDPHREPPFQSWDLSAQIGGSITRDRLWFFTGFQHQFEQTTPFGYDGVTTLENPKFITKITYKPNQNNTILGSGYYNHLRMDGGGADFGVLPERTTVDTCDVRSWNAAWISVFTSTTLEGRLGGFWGKCDSVPRNGDISAHFNQDTNVWSGNAINTSNNRRFSPQANFALTHYSENYLGSHEFKFGVQFQGSKVRDESYINGGFTYYSYTHSDYGYILSRLSNLQDTSKSNADVDQVGLYFHDTWNLNSNFALSLGLRWDHNRGSTDRGVVSSSDPIAPRIGLIWKIGENSPTVIKAHYGDYYDMLRTGQFVLLSDQLFGYQIEDFDNDTQQWPSTPTYREQNVYYSEPDNKHPFVRQFTVGMDRELPAGIAAGAHYIYRRWHNILEDVELNSNYEPVPFVNPVTGELITVYSSPPNNLRYRLLTNPEGLFRRYDGFEVYLNRRFLNQLALSGSFVYSKIRGNVPNGQGVISSSFSEFLNDPNQLINFNGRLVNDPTFAWKFSGIYDLPYGLNLGFFFWHESGDTWEPLVELPKTVLQGGVIFGLPRGSFRLPSQNILDMRVEKQFPLLNGQFRVTADIFNVLNAATVNGVATTWGYDDYGKPASFVEPRQIRLGLRYTF